MTEQDRIEQAIAALETQRASLGDGVVETSIAALRAKIGAEAGEKRSLLTVLFSDISGFSALSRDLDVEDMQEVMGQLWRELDQTIVSHNGQIDKHIGDRVMAVWGLAQPGENDPEQAVRAAWQMQAKVAALREEQGIALSIRIGVNTGLTSVSHIASTGELNIIGDTVNLASSLEQAAPTDRILLSQSTNSRVQGLFDVQRQPPLSVKGKAEPVPSYLVLRPRTRAFQMTSRGLAGITTRTVGRDAELAMLQGFYQQAGSGAGLQWVTICGPAGIGKSRLLADFQQWSQTLPHKPRFLMARAWPQTAESPYHLLRSLLASHFQIGDRDPLTVARAKLIGGLSEVLGAGQGERAAAYVGQLIGLDSGRFRPIANGRLDSEHIGREAETLLERYLGRLAATAPAVILLEDLQWGDEQSIRLLSHLFAGGHPWQMTVVGAARPELWARRTPWGASPQHQMLELQALPTEAATELVRELLQKIARPPAWLIHLLVERTGGNPYFTEELVKLLIERGMIETGPSTWTVHPDQPLGLSVPGTVQGVLQTRLQQLDQQDRVVLQQAAVVGPVFWVGAVDHISQEKVPAARWIELEQRGLISCQPTSQLPGEDEYHFQHSLLRDVVYEYTLKKQRQLFHQRAAEWLVRETDAERAGEWAAVIAAHYEQALQWDPAADWYEQAGKRAREMYTLDAASSCFQQALDLLRPPSGKGQKASDGAKRRLGLYEGLGEMLRLEARFPESARAYIGMLAAAEALGDSESSARAWNRAFRSLEDARAAVALGGPGKNLGSPEEERQLAALQLNLRGAIYGVLGSRGRADSYMQSTLSLLRELDSPLSADPTAAIKLCEHALEVARELGNLGGEMLCLTRSSRARIERKEWDAAVVDLLRVIELSEKVEWFGISQAHRLLAEALLAKGRTADAMRPARKAMECARAVEHQAFVGQAWCTLGRVAAQSGEPIVIGDDAQEASDCFARSVELFKRSGDRGERGKALLQWARYELEQGDRQKGRAMRQKANQILAQLGIRNLP